MEGSAHARHTQLMDDWMRYYGGAAAVEAAGGHQARADAYQAGQVVSSDTDSLKAGHRFIRTAEDDAQGGLAAKLARRYYDRLFREYCIADLSRYKEDKIGMRWRMQQEVVSGKGQFVCGEKRCTAKDGLASYEVNFAYKEAGQNKQALVKLRVCPPCALKLNHRNEAQFRKIQAKELAAGIAARQQLGVGGAVSHKRKAEEWEQGGKGRKRGGVEEGQGAAKSSWITPPPGAPSGTGGSAAESQGQGEGGAAALGQQGAVCVMSADESVWEAVPAAEAVAVEEEMDTFLEAMFL